MKIEIVKNMNVIALLAVIIVVFDVSYFVLELAHRLGLSWTSILLQVSMIELIGMAVVTLFFQFRNKTKLIARFFRFVFFPIYIFYIFSVWFGCLAAFDVPSKYSLDEIRSIQKGFDFPSVVFEHADGNKLFFLRSVNKKRRIIEAFS